VRNTNKQVNKALNSVSRIHIGKLRREEKSFNFLVYIWKFDFDLYLYD